MLQDGWKSISKLFILAHRLKWTVTARQLSFAPVIALNGSVDCLIQHPNCTETLKVPVNACLLLHDGMAEAG